MSSFPPLTRGIRFPGQLPPTYTLNCGSTSSRSSGATRIPRTPPFGNGNGIGGLTIRQEFMRIMADGIFGVFRYSLFLENSIHVPAIREMEESGEKATAALLALMHLSAFYSNGIKLLPREIVNEIFDPRNQHEYQPIIELLQAEDFYIPQGTRSGQDSFDQIHENYLQLAPNGTQTQGRIFLLFHFHDSKIDPYEALIDYLNFLKNHPKTTVSSSADQQALFSTQFPTFMKLIDLLLRQEPEIVVQLSRFAQDRENFFLPLSRCIAGLPPHITEEISPNMMQVIAAIEHGDGKAMIEGATKVYKTIHAPITL